ncbi:MAG: DUF1298 domain-containing protein [Hyphomicrobiales bacterium]|nr:DUF1298 domain-containing protein [Hyphomicrobiales bacterium]
MRPISLSDSLFFNLGDRYILCVCDLAAPCDLHLFRRQMAVVVAETPALKERVVRRGLGFAAVPDGSFDIAEHVVGIAAPELRGTTGLIEFSDRLRQTRLPKNRTPWRALVINPAGTPGCDSGSTRAVIFQLMHGLSDGMRGLQVLATMRGQENLPELAETAAGTEIPQAFLFRDKPFIPFQDAGVGTVDLDRRLLARAAQAGDSGVTGILVKACRRALARTDLIHADHPLTGRVAHTRMLIRRVVNDGNGRDLGNHLETKVDEPPVQEPKFRLLPRVERAQGSSWSQHLVAKSPPPLARKLMRMWISKFDAFVSLVPGPVRPIAFGGARMRAIYGVAPLSGPVPIAMTCVTYAGGVTLTVIPGPEAIADPHSIAAAILDEIEAMADGVEKIAAIAE